MGKKAHKQWLSLAMDMQTRQVIAFHVGDRNRQKVMEENPGGVPRG